MRWALVIGVAVLAAGCGGSHEKTADEKIRAQMAKVETTCAEGINCGGNHFRPFRRCTHVSRGFRACTTFFELKNEQTAIYRHVGDRWAKVAGPVPGRIGWWLRVIASPDRRTLLGQWSGECESLSTYLVSTADGKARPLFGQRSSAGLGWSADGRARVRLLEPIYATRTRIRFRAGTYRIDPVTLQVELERARSAVQGC